MPYGGEGRDLAQMNSAVNNVQKQCNYSNYHHARMFLILVLMNTVNNLSNDNYFYGQYDIQAPAKVCNGSRNV